MLFIQPHSGLANRIRVIVSGLNLSVKQSEPITILWCNDENLCCEFDDIYEFNNQFEVIKISFLAKFFSFARRNKFLKMIICYSFKIKNYILDSDIPSYVWSTDTNTIDFKKLSKKKGNSYFYTCHEFYFDRNLLQFLKPTSELNKKIALTTSLFINTTIGIHIRRTDHKEAIENSPIELFIYTIESEIVKDNLVQFFLATDDIQTEQLLKEKFGKRILTAQKNFERNSKDGMKGAMIDLYSLAATSKIYGSFYSSFSDIASRIGNIPLEILKKS